MKKIIVFALCILLSSSLFAVSWSDNTQTKPEQTITLNIGEDLYKYNIGFSVDGNKTGEGFSASTALVLSEDDKTVAENSTPLYVWWDIMTSKAFDVTLEVSGALTEKTPAGDQAQTIDFTVDGLISADEIKPQTHRTTPIDLSSDADVKSVAFLDVDAADSVANTYQGSQELTIKTKTGALAGKPEGDYSSTLTLSLTTY